MRSTSQQIRVVNSKLAQFILTKEEEEGILNYKKPRRRSPDEPKPTNSRSRWVLEPDFRIPSGLVDRPRTAVGGTTFHFEFIPVSKTVSPLRDNGQVMTWASRELRTSPVEHARYIERDGAAELVSPLSHAAYIERLSAIESVETPIEREGGPEPSGLVVAIYSNISDDPAEREAFWKQVPDEESDIRSCNLEFNFEQSPKWWEHLHHNLEIDAEFKAHALSERERFHQCRFHSRKFKLRPFKCSLDRGFAILRQVEETEGFDKARPPLFFRTRGGRIQYRIVLELPHELVAERRLAILHDVGDHLAHIEISFDEDARIQPVGMMFTGVIHAPDGYNDNRNYHLHVVAHDRRAALVDDGNGPAWVFEPKKLETTRDKNFVGQLRRAIADIVNKQMRAQGVERHYDHRTYEEMGINRTPTEHLGNSAHSLDSVGIFNPVGAKNGVTIWRDQEAALEAEVARIKAIREQAGRQLERCFASARTYGPDRDDVELLLNSMVSRSVLISQMAEEMRQTLLAELNEAKAKSRAVRTIRTCRAHLYDIAAGNADGFVIKNETNIRCRMAAAEKWLGEIDQALEVHREDMAKAKAKVERHDKTLRDFDQELMEFAQAVERAARTGQPAVAMASSLREKAAESSYSVGQAPSFWAHPANEEVSLEAVYAGPPTMEGLPIISTDESGQTEVDRLKPEPIPGPGLSGTDLASLQAEGGAGESKPGASEATNQPADKLQVCQEDSAVGRSEDRPQEISANAVSQSMAEPIPTIAGEASLAGVGSGQTAPAEPSSCASEGAKLRPSEPEQDTLDWSVEGTAEKSSQGAGTRPDPTLPPPIEKSSEPAPVGGLLGSSGNRIQTDPGPTMPSPEGNDLDTNAHVPGPAPAEDQGPDERRSEAKPNGPKPQNSASTSACPGNPDGPNQPSEIPAQPQSSHAADVRGQHASEAAPKTSVQPATEREKIRPAGPASIGQSKPNQAWEDAFQFVRQTSAFIKLEGDKYSVSDLPEVHAEALAQPAMFRRTQGRLAELFRWQEREVSRVLSWLNKHGHDEKNLILEGRKARLSEDAPDAIKTLLRRRHTDTRIGDYFRQESERREAYLRAIQGLHASKSGKGR